MAPSFCENQNIVPIDFRLNVRLPNGAYRSFNGFRTLSRSGSTRLVVLRNVCTWATMASTLAPTSQISPASLPPSVFTLQQTAQLEALYTIIRDKDTNRGDFLFYSDRIIRLLVEEGLNHLPVLPKTVETPTVCVRWYSQTLFFRLQFGWWQGATYDGVGFEGKICGVSILRAGEVSW